MTQSRHRAWFGGIVRILGLVALIVVGQDAMAQTGIRQTKHNLSTTGLAGNNRVTAGTDEVCVFCHTPHGADVTNAPGTTLPAAPLWNKNLAAMTGYTTYSATQSSTLDGQVLAVGSVSLACLSCHDGSQAMDNIINAPGSGGYDISGGGVTGRSYTWDTGTGRVDADGRLTTGPTIVANLTKDLTNDHPIGIAYCGGGQTGAAPAGACVDTDFVQPSSVLVNGTSRIWFVDTPGGTPTQREKSDMILYTRDFGAGVIGPSVECASCHDPHVQEGQGRGGATFLRVANAGSAVCLSCHVK